MSLQASSVVQFACSLLLALSACSPGNDSAPDATVASAPLKEQVEAAIAAASDLPQGTLTVAVSEGVVVLRGSLTCDECGGSATPGGIATIQQTLGAVVRAVPGVEEVRFEIQ